MQGWYPTKDHPANPDRFFPRKGGFAFAQNSHHFYANARARNTISGGVTTCDARELGSTHGRKITAAIAQPLTVERVILPTSYHHRISTTVAIEVVRGTVRGIVCFHPTNLYAVVPRTKCRKEQREERREENKSKEKKKEEEEKK